MTFGTFNMPLCNGHENRRFSESKLCDLVLFLGGDLQFRLDGIPQASTREGEHLLSRFAGGTDDKYKSELLLIQTVD